jgi:uncharacterized protein
MRTTDVVWRARGWPGVERLELVEGREGVTARSVLIASPEGELVGSRYEIICNARWRVERLSVESLGTGRRLELVNGADGRWIGAGQVLPALAASVDVDINLSPFTNTLAIRRLELAPGAAADLEVVYISLPELDVHPQRQRYTCLGRDASGGLYRYESGTFAADVAVDATGLVTRYEGLWDRVW